VNPEGAVTLVRTPVIYLDTQFAYAYLVADDPDHAAACLAARRLAEHFAQGTAGAIVSIMTVSELAWSLARLIYDRRWGSGAWQRTDRNHSFGRIRNQVAAHIQTLLSEEWITVAGSPASAVTAFPEALCSWKLSPADLSHLLIARAAGADAILTNDRHFCQLENPPIEVIRYTLS
jgi:predicted nucleic acid-binding protein